MEYDTSFLERNCNFLIESEEPVLEGPTQYVEYEELLQQAFDSGRAIIITPWSSKGYLYLDDVILYTVMDNLELNICLEHAE